MDRGERYSRNVEGKPSGMTVWFGMNLSASALGVSSVWMKMVRRACALGAGDVALVCPPDLNDGRCLLLEADSGDVRGESLNVRMAGMLAAASRAHRVVEPAATVGRVKLFARYRTAVFEAMVGRLVRWDTEC